MEPEGVSRGQFVVPVLDPNLQSAAHEEGCFLCRAMNEVLAGAAGRNFCAQHFETARHIWGEQLLTKAFFSAADFASSSCSDNGAPVGWIGIMMFEKKADGYIQRRAQFPQIVDTQVRNASFDLAHIAHRSIYLVGERLQRETSGASQGPDISADCLCDLLGFPFNFINLGHCVKISRRP